MENRIAIFASGNGTNAQRISEYFNENPYIIVSLILTNNDKAYVIQRAENLNIPSVVFSKSDLHNRVYLLNILDEYKINWIILAGFLLKIPDFLIKAFPQRIINIHPALLPKYGGKGMYGDNVHKAVLFDKETESGITIHFVNESYDEGKIIFQAKTPVAPNDTIDSLAAKIHLLEHKYFPEVIEKTIQGNI